MDTMPQKRHRWTKEETIKAIYKLSSELNRSLVYTDFDALTNVSMGAVRKHFGTLNNMKKELGLELVRDGKNVRCLVAIHRLVKDKINEVTDGRYQIISMKSDGRNIPDLWVKDTSSDKILPVEIKKKAFDAHAQKQLERYISSYDSGQGIAVGEIYTAASNPNIIFMPISMFR